MILHSFEYSEFQDHPRGWRLSLTEFGPINLVVGRNAAGKSRLLKVIHAFTQLVAGKQKELFSSGDWGVDLETPAGEHFTYKCALENKEVVSENLCLNGELLLDRANGRFPGRIKAANRPGEFDDFQIRPDQLAIYSKRDSIQQPHLELIADWAARRYSSSCASEFRSNQV